MRDKSLISAFSTISAQNRRFRHFCLKSPIKSRVESCRARGWSKCQKWPKSGKNGDKSPFSPLFESFLPKPAIPPFPPRFNRGFSPVLPKMPILGISARTPLFAKTATFRQNLRGLKNQLGPGGVWGGLPHQSLREEARPRLCRGPSDVASQRGYPGSNS